MSIAQPATPWTMLRLLVFGATMITLAHTPALGSEEEHGGLPHHHLSLFVGGGVETNQGHEHEKGMALGLEYELRFHRRWGGGIVVELLGQDTLRDLVLTVPISFHPAGGLRIFAGPGVEFLEEKRQFLARLGIGYEFEVTGSWNLAPEFAVDFGESGATTWLGGLALGHRF